MIEPNQFKRYIQRTIEACSFEAIHVSQVLEKNCTCINHATGQVNEKCPLCLGTGKKIIIKKIELAVKEDTKGMVASGKNSYISKTYYIKNNFNISDNDLIVENNEVYYIHRIEDKRGLKGLKTHYEVTAIKRKNGHNTILKNLENIIKQSKRR